MVEDVQDGDMGYFKSEYHRYMFILLHTDGRSRNKLLGIKPIMYCDKKHAKRWYKSICLIIHPDKNPGAYDSAAAMAKLTELYKILTM